LQPNARRPNGSGNGFPDSARRLNPGLFDQAPILGIVSAVHAPPGQVDHGVRRVDFGSPFAYRLGIPTGHPPRSIRGVPAEHDHVMAVGDEGTGQQRTDLPGSSRDNNLHASSLRTVFSVETLRLQP
jgi:hypothetical protein